MGTHVGTLSWSPHQLARGSLLKLKANKHCPHQRASLVVVRQILNQVFSKSIHEMPQNSWVSIQAYLGLQSLSSCVRFGSKMANFNTGLGKLPNMVLTMVGTNMYLTYFFLNALIPHLPSWQHEKVNSCQPQRPEVKIPFASAQKCCSTLE